MAYSEELDRRIMTVVGEDPAVTTRKMFGGICYMCNGNMALGLIDDELMVRVGLDHWEELLAQPHVREMDFTGRSMKGYVYVSAEGLDGDDQLERWVHLGMDFADSLPPKQPKSSTPTKRGKSTPRSKNTSTRTPKQTG